MDIVYHRNCLDGAFSAHLFYLISKVISQGQLQSFLQILRKKYKQKSELKEGQEDYINQFQRLTDLTDEVVKLENEVKNQQKMVDENKKQEGKQKINQQEHQKYIINQQFFHQPQTGISYYAYSIPAGQFFPLKFPTKNKILFILDTGLINYQNILNIGQKYQFIFIIDHHTSFQSIKNDILLYSNKTKKIFYIFSQDYCATKLCYLFLEKYFGFVQLFEEEYVQKMEQIVKYVDANDRKFNETKQSKSFVLGFYYFEIQLSHLNPLLNKRLGMINLDYLMEKGKNLYKNHLKELTEQVSKALICKIQMSGKLKGAKCYLAKPGNSSKISDLGSVLAHLSKKQGMQNLALLYLQRSGQIRISTRSHRELPNPLALQIAQRNQGGGHECAAGFRITPNKFKSLFTKLAPEKHKLKLQQKDIQNILFNKIN